MTEETKQVSPAYLAYSTFKNTIRMLPHNGRLPAKIDVSLLSSMSGSGRRQFMQAMKFFNLIDDGGIPAAPLHDLAAATDDAKWKPLMTTLVRTFYPKQLDLLTTGTPQQLRESFGEIGGIVLPAVRFLLAACKDCELPVSPHIMKAAPAGPRRRRPQRSDNGHDGPEISAGNTPLAAPQPAPDNTFKILADKFPDFDPGWPEPQQQAWFAAFEKLMALSAKKGGV